jgi:hypothetical protein
VKRIALANPAAARLLGDRLINTADQLSFFREVQRSPFNVRGGLGWQI